MTFITDGGKVDEVMNPQQAAEFLQLTEKSLRQYSIIGQVPTIKKGKRRFYLKSQLINHILGQQATA